MAANEKTTHEILKRNVVPGQWIRVGEEPVPVGGPRQPAPSEPQVTLIREGDVIKAIDVTCTCGKQMRLRCD